MDRGGTITWYLTTNDVDFTAGLKRARQEAKKAASDIDRDLNRSSTSVTTSLRKMGDGSSSAASNLRNMANQAKALAIDTNTLRSSLANMDTVSRSVSSSLGRTAVHSEGTRLSMSGLKRESNLLAGALGGIALGAFTRDLGNIGSQATKAGAGLGVAKLSLDDFRKNLSRSASLFRDFQIALRGFELTALIIGATVATGAIIELVGALTALGGLALTVPAGLAGFAGAFGALAVGTMGVADAFKEATKETRGVGAAQNMARRQADLMRNSMRQEEALTRRMNDLRQDYSDTLKELAEERMRKLNEEIQKGADAWKEITNAASDFLDVANRMDNISAEIAQAQMDLNSAIITYGASSIEAREATQTLFATQAKLASSNAQLDSQYTAIKDSVKDLSTNLESLNKANRNEMNASLLNLRAMRLEKQSRGENIDEITNMISLLEGLINIKDTKLTTNIDTKGAQISLDNLRNEFPDIAIAAKQGATSAETALTKSLGRIKDSMKDVTRERKELQADLKRSLADIATSASGAAAVDPFAGLSTNARKFVLALIEVKEAFEPVKQYIQDRLFAGLDTEIMQLADVYFPILKTGLGGIAGAMNLMALEASRVMQQPFFTGAVSTSLENTATATGILTKAIEPLAIVVTDLVNIGNPYVLMLANWVVKQSELAAAFTSSEEGQRKMTDAINLGITAMQQLGSFIGAVVGLFMDLFKVSNEAGISFIGTLTEMVNRARDWIATEEGQSRMKALFEATDTILRALLETVGAVVKGILAVVEAYNNLDGPMKTFITNLIVFSAIATPVITYLSAIWASARLVFFIFVEIAQFIGFLVTAFGKFSILTKVSGLFSKLLGPLAMFGKAKVGDKVGKSIAGVFKPLGSGAVLKGVAAAALVGVAITTIAFGISQASQAKIDVGKLAQVMLATTIIAGIFALIGTFGIYAGVGAIAGTLIGGALFVIGRGLADASKSAENVNLGNLTKLMLASTAVAGIFAVISPLLITASIGSTASALLGVTLPLIASGLQKASESGAKIDQGGLNRMNWAVTKVSVILTLLTGSAFLSAISSTLLSFMTSKLPRIALGILNASEIASRIDPRKLDGLERVIEKIAKWGTGNIFKNLGNLVNTTIIDGSVAKVKRIAQSIITTPDVPIGKVDSIKNALTRIASIDAGGILTNLGNLMASDSLAGIAGRVKSIATSLSQTPEVPLTNIENIKRAILSLSQIKIEGGGLFDGRSNAAEKLSNIAWHIREAAKHIGAIAGYDIAGGKSAAQILIDVINGLVGGIKANEGKFFSAGQNLVSALIRGVNSKATDASNAGRGIQSKMWSAIQAKMNDEYLQGRALASQVINGIISMYGKAWDAGTGLQGKFWAGIQSKMQDEYHQGRALAGKVQSGINSRRTDFRWSGGYLIDGFTNGMNSKNLYLVGRQIADDVLRGIKDRGREGSPWKTTYESGQWLVEGLANGIKNSEQQAIDAARHLAGSLVGIVGDVQGNATMSVSGSSFAPSLAPSMADTSGVVGSGVVINQTNEVYTDLDMDQVNRNLTWELNKI